MKAKDLIALGKDLEKMEQEGHCISYRGEVENTGVTELEPVPLAMWKEFVDLGGREIIINITVPNTKTLAQVVKGKK